MAEFTKERIIEDLKASTQNASGMFEIGEDTICKLMSLLTYAAPQLPQPAVETAHSSIIAEQLAHVLSGMKVTSHERAVINCAVDRLNKNAEMLQEAPAAPAAQEAILYEPSPTDSVNAPLEFTDVEDRAWVVGAEWMRDAFKGENPHLRIANDDDPAPITASGSEQWQNWIADVAEYLEGGLEADGELEAEGSIEAKRLLARRAAMLQGEGAPTDDERIMAIEGIIPVADLYEVTVPSGRSTTFTKDAAEAKDCADMGWKVQEYVTLERYQAAMLGVEPVSHGDWLPMDYLQGHKDGLEWAARMAEANHPQTGDWLYDDPLELAKAIRKGPDMPELKSVPTDDGDNFYSWFGRFWSENYQQNNYTTSAKQMLVTMAEFAFRAGRESATQVGNSPVMPDGWVSVPVEPTEDMVIAGFEAELREEFRDPEAWEAFEAMSGCEQAATRAKWCWAAMISAAPQQEASNRIQEERGKIQEEMAMGARLTKHRFKVK